LRRLLLSAPLEAFAILLTVILCLSSASTVFSPATFAADFQPPFQSHSPAIPLDVTLVALGEIGFGKESGLLTTVKSDSYGASVTVSITLPAGFAVVHGSTSWLGDIAGSASIELRTVIAAVRTGNWTIEARAGYFLTEGSWYGDVDRLYVYMTERSTYVSKQPLTSGGENCVKVSDALAISGEPSLPAQGLAVTPPPPQSPASPGTLTVTGRFFNYISEDSLSSPGNIRSDVHEPMVWGYVRIWRGDGQYLGGGITDTEGQFSISIENPGSSGFYVEMLPYTSGARIVKEDGTDYSSYTPMFYPSPSASSYDIGNWRPPDSWDYMGAWRIYETIVLDHFDRGAWDFLANEGPGYVPPAFELTVRFKMPDGHGTHYHLGGEIHIDNADYTKALDIVQHEYAHYIMYKVYGNWYPPSDCPSPHYINRISGPVCGWTEGWADNFPLSVQSYGRWNDPAFEWGQGSQVNLETPTWGTPNWDNGDQVEGRVAGTLWDIFDNAYDGYDTFTDGFLNIWDVIHGQTDNTFYQYYTAWTNRGHDSFLFLACAYQDTIDYGVSVVTFYTDPTNVGCLIVDESVPCYTNGQTKLVTDGWHNIRADVPSGYQFVWMIGNRNPGGGGTGVYVPNIGVNPSTMDVNGDGWLKLLSAQSAHMVTLYSVDLQFKGQDPSTCVDLHGSIYNSYQSQAGTTAYSFQVPANTLVTFSVSSSPSGWSFANWWDDYGYGQSNTPTFTINVGTSNHKVVAFFTPAFDFSLSNSGGITVFPGGSGSNTITVTLLTPPTQSVGLSCTSGLPSGASCSFNPASGNPTFTSTLTVSTVTSTPSGATTVTVTGSGGGKTHTTQFTLTVNPPPFDGDGLSDLVIYRGGASGHGNWYACRSSGSYASVQFIAAFGMYDGDAPLLGNFDGDGKPDLFIYRGGASGHGNWYVRTSSGGYASATLIATFGLYNGDVPLLGDFDGDGLSDLVIYRGGSSGHGNWYVRKSSTAYSSAQLIATFGMWDGDVPLLGNFDGDGKADLVIYRGGSTSHGNWYVRKSSDSYSFATLIATFGIWDGDIPLLGDFDGDGKVDLFIYRGGSTWHGNWYVRKSSDGYSTTQLIAIFGLYNGDVPLLGNFDGDGKADLFIYRGGSTWHGNWYVRKSSGGYASATLIATFGLYDGDKPLLTD